MARCKPCQAEMEGSREKDRKWLRVSSAWGRRRSQRSGGKEMWVEARVEMKWFLYGMLTDQPPSNHLANFFLLLLAIRYLVACV